MSALLVAAGGALAAAAGAPAGVLEKEAVAGGARLVFRSADGSTRTIATSAGAPSGERLVDVSDRGVLYATWDEATPAGVERRIAISLSGGAAWSPARTMSYEIPLKAGRLDPGVAAPDLPAELRGRFGGRLFIVQFETVGLDAWRRALGELGAEVLAYIPNHAHIVRMDPSLADRVRALPFVRWVGAFEPGYRLDPSVASEIVAAGMSESAPRRYNLLTFTPGPGEKSELAADVRAAGGHVVTETPNGYRVEATLTHDQILRLIRSDHLQWIDRWSRPENDMDVVREQAGVNYVEQVAGYSGQGVRAEVMDCGIMTSHQDFDGILFHGPSPSSCDHGTCTYGIVFGNGNRDGDGEAKATGSIPSAQGYFYDYDNLTDRYQETRELVSSPIFGVFQSNSWGDARTRAYTSISFEMDDIIFQNDVAIFQSQSNAGSQDSRPQAWAKNVISIGAVNHYDTPSLADDCWCSGGSIGPAEDGRIKPDLAYWYDDIYCPDLDPGGYSTGVYTPTFGGTSAATPITAGIGGLFFQMWADNILGNDPAGNTVFEKRPHAMTLKALMINTAEQYAFTGTTSDLTRMHQGWGLPSARRFYDRRGLLEVVDESNVLLPLDTHTYTAVVPDGQSELKVTMAYMDRPGTTSALLHRINDVTLKVTNPNGAAFWYGNNGLEAGNWSVAGGAPDTKNTVENVFIQNPVPGTWTIEVSGDDINQDAHVETPEVDQDYALVVYGATSLTLGCAVPPEAPTALTATVAGENRIDLSWTGTATARRYRIYRSAGGCGGTYALVQEVSSSQTSFSDTKVSGGVDYGYIVKAVDGCESAGTDCANAVATGPCILAPSFPGAASVSSSDASTCGATVSWAPGTPSCGGPMVYNVYRGTGPSFVPSAQNRVASCIPATSFVDTRNVGSNVTYYYIVRAEDLGGRGGATCNGAVEGNAVTVSALVKGPVGTILTSGFESGLEGWIPALGVPPATAGGFVAGHPTASSDGGQTAQPGNCAVGNQCLYTGANKGGNPNNGDVDAGEVLAASPAFDASAYATARLTLQRWHYNGATVSDSGDRFALDVSNDNGATWSTVETLGALASANVWTAVGFDLQAFRPLTAQMKLRVRSADGPTFASIVESAIDDVAVVGAQNCSSAVPGSPGAIGAESLRVDREGQKVRVSWAPECGGGTGYGIYRGELSAGYGSLAPLPGYCGVGGTSASFDPGPDSYFFLVAPNDGSVEGSLGRSADGTLRAPPASACWPRAGTINACSP